MRIRDALLNGLIDYAGLFPPAGEDMRTAVDNYFEYTRGPDRAALARFVVPLARLQEFEETAADRFPRERNAGPWRVSVLVADDVRHAGEQMQKFNARHSTRSPRGVALIDVVELKASSIEEVANQQRDLPAEFTSYFEIPLTPDLAALVQGIGEVSARAKIRTGGLTPEAIPSAQAIADFMLACRAHSVAFKATAGLHHPVRGEYAFTYERDSAKGMMHGFLNVFLAAALVAAGDSEDIAVAVLEETNPAAFEFYDDFVKWRDKRINAEDLDAVRSSSAISFGSCSFRQPIDELAPLFQQTQPSRT